MADIYDITEQREIASVLYDQLDKNELNAVTVTEADMIAMIDLVKLGKRFVIGQIVMLRSINAGTSLGSIPAVVTEINKVSLDAYEYKLTILSGDLNDEFLPVIIGEAKVPDAITITEDMTAIVAAVRDSKLGKPTLRDLKLSLGIEHMFTFNTTTEKLDSMF